MGEREYALGRMYFLGDGVAADERVAAAWYERAVDLGHVGAHRALGRMYLCGAGVDRDVSVATSLLRAAAERGDVMAQCALAEALYERDGGASRAWYERAAAGGSADAARALQSLSSSRL